MGYEDIIPFTDMLTNGYNQAVARTYVWDSENRLIEVRPTNPDPNDVKVTYAYDYRGRRFERKKYEAYLELNDPNDPNDNTVEWDLAEHRKFLYDGERLLLELVVDPNEPNDPDSDTVTMKYTWGLDLFGQRAGGFSPRGSAGGIGALLAVWDADDPNEVHAVLHDANGNVVEVLSPATDPNDPNTAIVAHYEYDVYGNRTNPLDPNDPNDTEFEQPFRYASKWRDPDTGLVDFGRRWYFADHGRWLNRDPIGTAGGVNIYAYVMNSPANRIDPLGLAWLPCPYADGCPPLYGASPFCPGDEEGGGGGNGGGPPRTQPWPPESQPSTQPAKQKSKQKQKCEALIAEVRNSDKLVQYYEKELQSQGCSVPPMICVDSGDPGEDGSCTSGDYGGWPDPNDATIRLCSQHYANKDQVARSLRHELGRQIYDCNKYGPGPNGRAQITVGSCTEEIEELLFILYLEDPPGPGDPDPPKHLCGQACSYCDHPFYTSVCGSPANCHQEIQKQMAAEYGTSCACK